MMVKKNVITSNVSWLKLKIRRAYYNRASKFTIEIVSTDYRPVELVFPKIKGSKKKITVDIEDFIVK
jgi:transposase